MSDHNRDVMMIISLMRLARKLAKEFAEDVCADPQFVNNVESECWEYLDGSNLDIFSDEDDVLATYEKLMTEANK